MGLSLGIGLSLVLAPVSNDTCHPSGPDGQAGVESSQNGRSAKSSANTQDDGPLAMINFKGSQDYGNGDDFEPRVKPVAHNNAAGVSGHRKSLRPRYASTELGIKEKLFVGVLTTKETIGTMGVAVNKTLAHQLPKVVFFMNMRGDALPTGMSVVIFSDDQAYQLPFHMFKYIGDHYFKSYDWFFFMPDTTYLQGQKLLDMVSHISISYHQVYLGTPFSNTKGGDEKPGYCHFGNGILLSQVILLMPYYGCVGHLVLMLVNLSKVISLVAL